MTSGAWLQQSHCSQPQWHEVRCQVETVSAVCCFSTKKMFPTTSRDVLPMTDQSNIVYLSTCECRREYIGKTTQRFEYRIDQHIPQNVIALVTSSDTQPEKRRRGRPPKVSKPAQPEDNLRRSQRPKEASKQLGSPLHDNLPVTLPSDLDVVFFNAKCPPHNCTIPN